MSANTVNTGHPEKFLTSFDRGLIDRKLGSPAKVAKQQQAAFANKPLKPRNKHQSLTEGEYIVADQRENNNQVASARWKLVQAIELKLPAFGEELRKKVYPAFARIAGKKADYWQIGWKFSTWQVLSDRHNELTPLLLTWARAFNLEKEAWILEGALQTMSVWRKFADARSSLDLKGFCASVCGKILISDQEHSFSFENRGWDPQLSSWPEYRASVKKSFETDLRVYEKRIRALVQLRGGQRAALRYSVEHFEWLALYHCGGWSLDRILKCSPHAGGKTTVSKGLKRAAKLARLEVRPKRGKLKSA